jgi:hypothetical protein
VKIRGREYVDYEEYLDEKQQYRLDAAREGRFEKQREEELGEADDERIESEIERED